MSPSAVALWTERALVAISSSEARLMRTPVRESQSKPMLRGKPPATQNPVSFQSVLVIPRSPLSAFAAQESLKFERSGIPGLNTETDPASSADAFSSGVPVIPRSTLLPLHA